jgi:hypothetical protein
MQGARIAERRPPAFESSTGPDHREVGRRMNSYIALQSIPSNIPDTGIKPSAPFAAVVVRASIPRASRLRQWPNACQGSGQRHDRTTIERSFGTGRRR